MTLPLGITTSDVSVEAQLDASVSCTVENLQSSVVYSYTYESVEDGSQLTAGIGSSYDISTGMFS